MFFFLGLEGFLRPSESTQAPGRLALMPRGKQSLDLRQCSATGEETKGLERAVNAVCSSPLVVSTDQETWEAEKGHGGCAGTQGS